MFVVDTSGSNAQPTTNNGTQLCQFSGANCAPPTDPKKAFRGGSISAFYNNYQMKNNFSWGFEVFSGSSATAYITSGGVGSFEDRGAMASAIKQFYAQTDDDATPYIAALDAVQTAIAKDPDLHSVAQVPPIYVVIFMSDGYPTDALLDSGAVDQQRIDHMISSIIALAPGRVTLSTIYYGTINDPIAAGTLQTMAKVGGGQFVNIDTSNMYSFAIDDVITIQPSQCN